ncbi:MAG: DUF885 domain-containing protein [Bacteriovoracaceae bacterium]|nr:DUF885 domain-containing protein [Bacteriovoracaceae bacterium]
MKKSTTLTLLILVLSILSGCATYTPEQKAAETKRLNTFFERIFNENIKRYPTWQTYLGLKTNYGLLNNETEAYDLEALEISKKHLKELTSFNYDSLTHQGKLSYTLYKKSLEDALESWKWRYHGYPLNQMFGYHSGTTSFMINMHRVSTKEDALAYISRLKEIKRVFAERMVHNLKQRELGIIPPAFVYSKVIEDSQNIIKGYPFTKKEGRSPLYADFVKKVDELKIKASEKSKLKAEAANALLGYVGPAYKDLINYMVDTQKLQKNSHGAWSLPNGEEYYRYRLKKQTTTDMSPAEIHEFGLKEVARIHKEMREIMASVGFKGSLQDFFQYMKTEKKFTYPDTPAGKEAYLTKAREIIETMEKSLPKMFKTLPKARVTVKAVEPYREKSAGIAFYQGPSLFGDRPGIYYVNLYKMEDNPIYKMEGLAYHEALPGHHMQIAIKTELEELPKFRRTGGYTAYSEGWGLYSEKLPKEYGFYQDPYSDFGRLTMELWRAARLVTDTGLHYKKWSREEGIKYLKENTPNANLEIMKGIERYIVMPGQATTYKIGMQKIQDLRDLAKEKLGSKFDIRDFHDVILRSGPLPLDILEEQVVKWVAK